ncbi:DNA polymerase IV [Actinomyces sp. zg-332]|uniref:DNA polymerase IV n=1 Tax=Actinomyces sp. zg-332 TaxID=2708340 RepID=UPI0014221B2A|nr:DNA polymerase IV [Actinomyces sp. zg-332]QPK94416.1 DNA polymerase IV [Actinomyces sp. zg-332]
MVVDNLKPRFDDTDCNILHIDMDCFFAACEEKFNPQLSGKPIIVGGVSVRGVVSTANYEARKFGVHSAMATKQAQARCPKGVFLRPRMSLYKKMSSEIFKIFARYTDKIEPISIDEAFLDVSSQTRVFGSPVDIAKKIKKDIFEELGIVASIGIAQNMFLAKIASSKSKPDGLLVIPKKDSMKFLSPMPISVIWGLGKKSQQLLHAKGYEIVSDLYKLSDQELQKILGNSLGTKVFDLIRCVDRRKVGQTSVDKSFSNERTFSNDIYDYKILRTEALYLVKKCGFSLRTHEFLAKTISLKLKFTDFSSVTRDKTLYIPTVDDEVIFDTIMNLLESVDISKGVRLLGVKVTNLIDSTHGIPQALFDDFSDAVTENLSIRRENVLKVSDELKSKYGESVIFPASLLKHEHK